MKYSDFIKLNIPIDFSSEESSLREVFNQLPTSCFTTWGTTQFIIMLPDHNLVMKIPFRKEWNGKEHKPLKYDYCSLSTDLYLKAAKNYLGEIFSEIYLFRISLAGDPLYLQEKVIEYTKDDKIRHSIDSHNKAKVLRKKYRHYITIINIPDDWLADCIEYYGFDYVERFIKFIIDNKINDIHNENIGYRKGGAPCVFDYAGYDY